LLNFPDATKSGILVPAAALEDVDGWRIVRGGHVHYLPQQRIGSGHPMAFLEVAGLD